MANAIACPKCGAEMDTGKVEAVLNYLSDHARPRFWSLGAEVRVSRARACPDCGYVELYLDPEVLRNKVEQEQGRMAGPPAA